MATLGKSTCGRYRGRIVRPIPYRDNAGTDLVAPVGAYHIDEVGEHLHFFAEELGPFQMAKSHALHHRSIGNLEIEDWQS